MITQIDKETVKKICEFLEKNHVNLDKNRVNWETVDWIILLNKMVYNLDIASLSYRNCTNEDKKRGYFTVECLDCGWWGSSRLLNGGGPLGDTGDYSDSTCPVCDRSEWNEK